MAKSFSEGIDELKELVGSGILEGKISVNQVYAHYQDSGAGPHGTPAELFKHPRGGEAGYLSLQVTERHDEIISAWAEHLFRGDILEESIRILLSFADQVFMRAPREFEILRNSTALSLEDDGAPVYLQPAIMPRMSEEELKALRAASGGSTTPVLKRLAQI